MHSTLLIVLIAFAACVFAHAAPESKDSPLDVMYGVTLNSSIFYGGLFFYSADGYVSVGIAAELIEEKGPFQYQIHQHAVPEGADCSSAEGNFNPYDGQKHASDPADMEVGDLSGKHGALIRENTYQVYEDKYLSLNSENKAYIGGLSVVVESADGTKVACGNIAKVHRPDSMEGIAKAIASSKMRLD